MSSPAVSSHGWVPGLFCYLFLSFFSFFISISYFVLLCKHTAAHSPFSTWQWTVNHFEDFKSKFWLVLPAKRAKHHTVLASVEFWQKLTLMEACQLVCCNRWVYQKWIALSAPEDVAYLTSLLQGRAANSVASSGAKHLRGAAKWQVELQTSGRKPKGKNESWRRSGW